MLRDLSKRNIGNISKKVKEAWTKLCECQNNTMMNPTQESMEDESKAYERWLFLAGLEEKILSQKAKLHWLNVGRGMGIIHSFIEQLQ